MTTVSVAICAHKSRQDTAEALAKRLDDAPICWDNIRGAPANHDATLRLALDRKHADWFVAIEDDARPIPNFLEQAAAALHAAPAPIVSLYLGWVGAPRRDINMILRTSGAHWVLWPGFTSAVCVAVRVSSLYPFLEQTARIDQGTTDERYSLAAARLGHEMIPHANPSLVEHGDLPSVSDGGVKRSELARRAYAVGERSIWTGRSVTVARKIWDHG